MINWDLIAITLVIGFFALAGVQFLHILYREIIDSNEEKRRISALRIYNKREIEFIHDKEKWDKWKEQNFNICKIVNRGTYY